LKGEGRAFLLNLLYERFETETKRFALDVILFTRKLPRGDEFMVIKRQLIRSATSVAANYRAMQRAKSKAEFINKMGTTEEEADESLFWLECLTELATSEHAELNRLLKEANELTAILVASRKRARE
jgi:four helix bundle protein